MGILKKFFGDVFHEPQRTLAPRPMRQVSEAELEAHLSRDVYGEFRLTDAVRPSYDLSIVPRQGYRHDVFRDDNDQMSVPVIMASADRDVLLDLFFDLLEPLGGEIDVVLETSHQGSGGGHTDLYREAIDMPVLKSTLLDFEDILLNDGCTGVAVLNPARKLEVQFDEHKLLVVYGDDLAEFEKVFAEFGVDCDEELRFITEAEHVHSSREGYWRRFQELRTSLGVDGSY